MTGPTNFSKLVGVCHCLSVGGAFRVQLVDSFSISLSVGVYYVISSQCYFLINCFLCQFIDELEILRADIC